MISRRIVLEVATSALPLSFRHGRLAARARHAPMLRGASVADAESGLVRFFSLDEYQELWRALRAADEIVTWNGNRVALLVLRQTFGAEHFPIRQAQVGVTWAGHCDLCALIE